MEYSIYSDASYSPKEQLAIMGHMSFSDQISLEDAQCGLIPISFLEVEEKNNIRAEIRCALWALTSYMEKWERGDRIQRPQVVLFTDCQGVSGLLDRREKLERLNFQSQRQKKPLANADLYKEFYKIYDLLTPKIVWLKGHRSRAQADQHEKVFSVLDRSVRKHLREKLEGKKL